MNARLAILLLALTGCPDGSVREDAPACSFDLQWGRATAAGFDPFVDGDQAEIVLGFQGFRYILSMMRLSGVETDMAVFRFQVAVEGHEPSVQGAGAVGVEPGADGAGYARDVLVFFNDIPISQLVGRDAHIIATGEAQSCRGQYSATVRLVDDDDCVELADGGFSCSSPDAGP